MKIPKISNPSKKYLSRLIVFFCMLMPILASKSSQTLLKTWFWANFRQIAIFKNHDFQKSVEKLWKRVKSEYFFARNPIFTTPGAENGTFAGHQWASHQAKKSHNKTPEVFFHAAFDFDAPGLQNTDKKWENDRFLKNRFFKNFDFSKIGRNMILTVEIGIFWREESDFHHPGG